MSHFRVLVDAPAFVASLTEAIGACRRTLLVQFSTFEGDASGERLVALLLDARARGVDVRVSLDHYSDVIVNDAMPFLLHRRHEIVTERRRTAALLDEVQRAGVQVRRTAPVGTLGRYLFFRDHKKLVVLDDEVAFIGGLNVSEHNFSWHDVMVRTDDLAVVRDTARDFRSTWDGATVALDDAPVEGSFVLNHAPDRPRVLEEVLKLIDGARRSLVIESPYLLGDRIEPAIRRAAERGVRVTLVMPRHANHAWVRWWVPWLLRRLDHPNVECFGFPAMMHAKFLVADGLRSTCGSCNFLEAEALTQKELNLFSDDPELAQALEAVAQADVRRCVRLMPPRSRTSAAVGRATYTVGYAMVRWWTRRLVRRPEWRATYC